MEPIVLTDPNVHPTDALVFSIIGKNSVYWQQLNDYLHENHIDVTGEWKFFKDGKSWLYRALRKNITIFWIGVQKDTFRISFWLNEKALPVIEASDLSKRIIEGYRDAKAINHNRCITVVIGTPADFKNVVKLIELKMKIR